MPTVLTLPELTTVCDNAIDALRSGDDLAFSMYSLLYNTGLRSVEVLDITRWTNLGTGYWRVQLAKREYTRDIDESLIEANLKAYYTNALQNALYTYSFLECRIAGVTPVIKDGILRMRRTTHLFRYRFIRQLHADGLTDAAIQAIMGQKNLSSTQGYINRNLWLY